MQICVRLQLFYADLCTSRRPQKRRSRLCQTIDLNLQPLARAIIKYLCGACGILSVWDLCKYSVCSIAGKQDISWVFSKAHLSQMFICLHGTLRMTHTFTPLAGWSYGFIPHCFINMLFSSLIPLLLWMYINLPVQIFHFHKSGRYNDPPPSVSVVSPAFNCEFLRYFMAQ